MKNQFFFMAGLLALFLVACQSGQKKSESSSVDSFSITGHIGGMDSGWVMIAHVTGDSLITDSAAVINNAFTFTGVQPEPSRYSLRLKGTHQTPLRFFVENAKINVSATKDSFSAADVSGSPSEAMFKSYQAKLAPVMSKIDTLDNQYADAYKNKNSALIQSLDQLYDSLSNEKKQVITAFVAAHSGSVISAWSITRNFLYNPDAEQLNSLYHSLDTTAQQSSYGKKIKTALDIAQKLAIGKTAPDFTQNNVDGDPFSLSSLRGKYVLIDFWASWCGPCRAENPNVVNAYNKYKDNGFTVLGVSLDENKVAWKKAIKHDHLAWHQVSDLKGWKNAVAQQYGIRAIPSNFLIDPQGKIIGHTLRGEKLNNKLAAIFSR